MPIAPSSTRLSARARSLKPSATLAVTARAKELKAQGLDVIGFGAGEPDFDTADVIKNAAIEAIRAGRTGYEPVAGAPDARAAIARKLTDENGIDARPDDIVISVGAKHSLFLALQAIVDPGREVVVPTPAWVSYHPMIELCGAVPVEVAGAVSNDFKITPEQLAASIRPETTAILLNSPSNPCGTMYTEAELRALGDVLAAHEHVTIISDEIYEKLVYTDVAHFSIGSVPALRERTVTVNGMSKAFAMTGWRLGYAHAPSADPASSIVKAMTRLQSQMTSHPTSFCMPAIVAALEHGGEAVDAMRRVFAERAEVIHRLLSEIPGVVCPRPTGAFYAFPDISVAFGRTSPEGRTIDSALSFAEALLQEVLVAVVPGEGFGEAGRCHVRLSFACATEQIVEGCGRIRTWMESLT